jgi:ABC-type glycerol-3-phosphate transport system substrate-binding protein
MKFFKLIALLLAVAIVGTACGQTPAATPEPPAATEEPTAVPTAAPTEAPTAAPVVEPTLESAETPVDTQEIAVSGGLSTGADSIVLAVNTWQAPYAESILVPFYAEYPDINVEIVSANMGDTAVMAGLAASGQLPDVYFDITNPGLTTCYTNGWLHPLDEFVAEDPEFAFVPTVYTDKLRINGKLYAIPFRVHINNMIGVNLDLTDELNLDPPEFNWTLEEFFEFIAAGTTSTSSGINHLPGLMEVMAPAFSPTGSQNCYDAATHTFDLSTYFLDAVAALNRMKSVPGMVADLLRDPENFESTSSDYALRFGEAFAADYYGAWHAGRSLTIPISMSSEAGEIFDQPFNAAVYPFPGLDASGGRPNVQMNFCYMGSTTKYPDASFALLRWFSYSVPGVTAYADYLENENPNGLLQLVVTNPAIIDRLSNFGRAQEGWLWTLEHMSQGYMQNDYQLLPNYNPISEFLEPLATQVNEGVDVTGLVAEAQQKANEAMAQVYVDFDAVISRVEGNFEVIQGNRGN